MKLNRKQSHKRWHKFIVEWFNGCGWKNIEKFDALNGNKVFTPSEFSFIFFSLNCELEYDCWKIKYDRKTKQNKITVTDDEIKLDKLELNEI